VTGVQTCALPIWKKKSALREALYGGIPNWIWFDRERTAEGAPGNLRATLLPWDSTLCSFMFLEEDGSDIDHLKIVGHRTKQEMFEAFPDRKKTFEEHLNMLNTTPDYLNSILGLTRVSTPKTGATCFSTASRPAATMPFKVSYMSFGARL
jgi:hypothetical protein